MEMEQEVKMKRESDNNKDQHQSHLDTLTSLQYALCEGCVLSLARRCSNHYYRTLIDLHDNGGTRIEELHPSCSLVITNNYHDTLCMEKYEKRKRMMCS